MYTYCIIFWIADHTVNGESYANRREQLVNNARAENGGY